MRQGSRYRLNRRDELVNCGTLNLDNVAAQAEVGAQIFNRENLIGIGEGVTVKPPILPVEFVGVGGVGTAFA